MIMNSYILVEAVNIYASVFDTEQLSIIRGSSFILKQAIIDIKKALPESISPISTGASSGLFQIIGGCKPEDVCIEICNILDKSPFHHFTFLVEHCIAEDLLAAKEKLLAQLRIRQMSSLSVAPDRFEVEHEKLSHPCELEGCRVAASKTARKVQVRDEGTTRKLSLSTYTRLLHGIDKKQSYYFEDGYPDVAEDLKDYGFTSDLQNLADNPDYSRLNNKMAVVYIDGNRFSAIQRDMLESAKHESKNLVESLSSFDQAIQDERLRFLHNLLLEMIEPEGGRFSDAVKVTRSANTENKVIRFETLIWGGDEMLFVLPAWLGMEFVQYFYEKTANWEVENARSLTHTAGIVFCSVKSPIGIISKVAQSMVDTVKKKLGDDREKDMWTYMVLESIDYPTTMDIDAFNNTYYGDWAKSRPAFLTPGSNWVVLKQKLASLIKDQSVSRRQFYKILEAADLEPPDRPIPPVTWSDLSSMAQALPVVATAQEVAERRMLQLISSDDRTIFIGLLEELSNQIFCLDINVPAKRMWLWIHLVELWDYLLPQKKEVGRNELS